MKKSRHSDNQIMTIIKPADAGTPLPELCREHGMSSASFYKWRSKYGGMDTSMMTRLKEILFHLLIILVSFPPYRCAERQVCRPAYLSTAGRLRHRSPDANTFAGRQIKGTLGVDIKRLVPLVKISNHAIDAIIGRAMGAANQLLTKRLFTIF
jgi:hypothetical protein